MGVKTAEPCPCPTMQQSAFGNIKERHIGRSLHLTINYMNVFTAKSNFLFIMETKPARSYSCRLVKMFIYCSVPLK